MRTVNKICLHCLRTKSDKSQILTICSSCGKERFVNIPSGLKVSNKMVSDNP